ncbi:hypothetical protein [Saccharothrix variisporea]|uniref:Transcriptional regulator n=1 Tax=Saccharothrix variisporea TaxID=543527 RepID=A0A495XBQ9_9PSEU|nr:hypothetical protein [Saccharothrix variisporea]RKT68958.1 hypothetical protein DFJ66_2151 [Saccharothrix variisporea]
MNATTTDRDRAVLRAVAAGRCAYVAGTLLVDGLACCDQFLGPRLVRAGLIVGQGGGPARLTPAGRAVLDATPIAA